MKLNTLLRTATLALGLVGLSGVSLANSISFTTSVGTQPSDVGIITLTQFDANTVTVLLDLKDGYGLLNTGGPHTPFAFTLLHEDSLSISFNQPTNGAYNSIKQGHIVNNQFTLVTNDPTGIDNSPYGSYGVGIYDSAGAGSGQAYYGDLSFNLHRTGGLTLTDFIKNLSGYYFSADITNAHVAGVTTGNTGAQAWGAPTPPPVPDSGTTAILLGLGLISLALVRRKAA